MNVRASAIGLAVAFLVTTSAVLAADRLVPSEYSTIQAAIDAAVDGDTIIVSQGTYHESIDSNDKSFILTSTDPNDPNVVAGTVIDADGSRSVIILTDTPGAECVLAGLTITGGEDSDEGGGVCCEDGTLTIRNCVFSGNIAEDGGGIFNDSGSLTVINCTFSENEADGGHGGGIYSVSGELTLINCTFTGNSATLEGGGVATDYKTVIVTNCTFSGNSADYGGGMNNSHFGATATNCLFIGNSADEHGGAVCIKTLDEQGGETLRLTNCTFSGNSADEYGGAVCYRYEGDLTLTNCILWGNNASKEGPQVAMLYPGTASIRYCCLQGGESDVHAPLAVVNFYDIISDDPCFADEPGGDYHLLSSAGRWDANTSVWVTDDNNSPCIDAGDPNSDWTAELWPHGKRVNIGAFGGTPQASMSESEVGNIADLDPNGSVNWGDLKILTNKWFVEELLLSEDLNRDGTVNSKDYAVFANNWAWEQ